MPLATPHVSATPDITAIAAAPAAHGADLLWQMGRMGLFQTGVPVSLGGNGGQLSDLYADARSAQAVATLGPYAPHVYRAQRLAIEALLQSHNVALKEFIVPDLVRAERAGAVVLDGPVLSGKYVGNGWQLDGHFEQVANLVWSGFSLMVQARLADDAPGWLMLRSEEDGLYATPGEDKTAWRGATLGVVKIQQVFFRHDEWLGTDAMTPGLRQAAERLDRWLATATSTQYRP